MQRVTHSLSLLGVLASLLLITSLAPASASATKPAAQLPAATPCPPAWNFVSSPNPGSLENSLLDLAVISANDIWAVGYYDNGNDPARTLIQHWNGQSWTIVPSPNRGNNDNMLHSIWAVAANDIWAVGGSDIATGSDASLTLHWNGQTWAIVASPNINATVLRSVSATGPNDVWAVGSYQHAGGYFRTFTVHWDGSVWSIIPSPNIPNGFGGAVGNLSAVTALTSNDVWAVGSYRLDGPTQTLTMHWNGTSWTIVPSPNGGVYELEINDLDASDSSSVWLVGSYQPSMTNTQSLVQRWNGQSWIVVPNLMSNEANHFLGMDVVSASNIWVVGYSGIYGSRSLGHNLVAHWDGQSWINVPAPRQGNDSYLEGVAEVSLNNVWAVGSYREGGLTYSQIVHYTATCGTPTPQPTATLVPTYTPAPCGTFIDVGNQNIFYNDIVFLACRGVISGFPNGEGTFRFEPNTNTTRGQFAKIATLGFALPAYTPSTPTFSDVPPGNVFYQFVEAAAHVGAITGFSDGTFRPNQNVTRAQVAVITLRARGYAVVTPTSPTFTDVPTSNFAYAAIETLAARSIVSGAECGSTSCFRPNDLVRRDELSKVVRRAIEAVP